MNLFDPKIVSEERLNNRQVVRLSTSWWKDSRGIHMRKSLLFLRRKSDGYQILEEDCDVVGADEVIPRIVNLSESKDGIYDVIICNERRDYETGTIDDYDYKLIAIQ